MSKLIATFDHAAGADGACLFLAQPYNEANQGEHLQAILSTTRSTFRNPRLVVDDLTGYGDPVYAMEQAREWIDEYRDDLDTCGMTETMQTLGTFLGTKEFTACRDTLNTLFKTDESVRSEINDMSKKIMTLDTFNQHATEMGWSDVERQRAASQDAVLKLSSLFTMGSLYGARPMIYNGVRPQSLALLQQKMAQAAPSEFPALMTAYFEREDEAAPVASSSQGTEPEQHEAPVIPLFGRDKPSP